MKQRRINKVNKVFQNELGRNASSQELDAFGHTKKNKITQTIRSGYGEYYGAGGGGGGSSAGKTSATSAVDLGSTGGEPRANVTIPPFDLPKRPDPNTELGLSSALDPEAMAALDETTIDALSGLRDSASKLSNLSDTYLKGEIPADVQAQVRRLTSQKGLASGIGRGQAGEALTARDLGLTSLEITNQGANLATAASALRESMSKISESRRSFDKEYALRSAEMADIYHRTDIDASKVELARRQFNAEVNGKLVSYVADLALNRAKLQIDLARSDIEDTNVIGGIEQVMSQLESLIGKASAT